MKGCMSLKEMSERVSRKDDEGLYQPKIHSKRIRELHQISELTGLPMTVVVDLALRKFTENYTLIPYTPLSDGCPLFVPERDFRTGSDTV
jgi:hypothetical protein